VDRFQDVSCVTIQVISPGTVYPGLQQPWNFRHREKFLRDPRKRSLRANPEAPLPPPAREWSVRSIIQTPASILAVCQDCGTHLPVIADACHATDKAQRMPVAEASVEGKPVSVLRDTGCSTIVVRRSLVTDDKLTGQEERCILIDGTVRYTPVAEIFVETPFYSGVTTAVCMKNPIYDLVIGNVPGAQDETISQPVNQTTQAVQTRSQTKNTRGLTPLITPLIDLGTEDIAKLQAEDETLRKAMESAQQGDKSIYQLHRGFLYRVKSNRQKN